MNDPVLARPRLLVVDDQPINLQALYRTFGADHQVLTATSGAQALQVARAQAPELILLDLELGDLHGFEVCRQLKADALTAEIPVIFVTATRGEEAETQGLQAGAVDFINKPINPAIVRARVGTHLTLKRQSDQLRRMAFLDGLTGLYNRRAFDDRLLAEVGRAARSAEPLALLLLDVDFFKRFNDHYGHLAGDDTLRQVGGVLKAAMLRPVDMAARYGGEEFACLLPATPLEGAVLVAERLREGVAALAIAHARSEVAAVVTASIGAVADTGRTRIDGLRLIEAADAALYEAKRNGRNRVCAHAL